MSQEPKWEKWEFEIVMNNPELTDEELKKKLPRTLGAIQVVREGIHMFHMDDRNYKKILSKMMVCLLEDKNRLRTQCWKCKEWF